MDAQDECYIFYDKEQQQRTQSVIYYKDKDGVKQRVSCAFSTLKFTLEDAMEKMKPFPNARYLGIGTFCSPQH